MATATVRPELTIVDVVGTMAICTVSTEARLRSEFLPVTALTRDVRVRAVEREAGLCVVVEQPLLPVDRVMAQCTIFAEAPLVGVTLTVATDAVLGRIAEHVRRVALAAVGFRVPAEQREAGEIVVEEDVVLPRRLAVAVETLRALRTFVGIVVLVAGEAIPLQLRIIDRLDMTRGAFGFAVRADQRVARILAVVEAHFRPTAAGVAGFAALAEMPVVIVILAMAGDAGHVELVGERVLAVAALATLLGVLAVEHEIRIAIVIEARIVPAPRAVAVAAFIAAAAIVRIVFCMTVVAFRRRVPERVIGVAVEACRFLVLADQRVPGCIVVELDVQPLRR